MKRRWGMREFALALQAHLVRRMVRQRERGQDAEELRLKNLVYWPGGGK